MASFASDAILKSFAKRSAFGHINTEVIAVEIPQIVCEDLNSPWLVAANIYAVFL